MIVGNTAQQNPPTTFSVTAADTNSDGTELERPATALPLRWNFLKKCFNDVVMLLTSVPVISISIPSPPTLSSQA